MDLTDELHESLLVETLYAGLEAHSEVGLELQESVLDAGVGAVWW